jgi:hypothetical protein
VPSGIETKVKRYVADAAAGARVEKRTTVA